MATCDFLTPISIIFILVTDFILVVYILHNCLIYIYTLIPSYLSCNAHRVLVNTLYINIKGEYNIIRLSLQRISSDFRRISSERLLVIIIDIAGILYRLRKFLSKSKSHADMNDVQEFLMILFPFYGIFYW